MPDEKVTGERILRGFGSFLWQCRRIWAAPLLFMVAIVLILVAVAMIARAVPWFVAIWRSF